MFRHEIFDKQSSIIAIALAVTLFVGTETAFTAQELRVGFIPGRGDDATVEEQAFELAGIEYETIGTGDYTLGRLLEFDSSRQSAVVEIGNEIVTGPVSRFRIERNVRFEIRQGFTPNDQCAIIEFSPASDKSTAGSI